MDSDHSDAYTLSSDSPFSHTSPAVLRNTPTPTVSARLSKFRMVLLDDFSPDPPPTPTSARRTRPASPRRDLPSLRSSVQRLSAETAGLAGECESLRLRLLEAELAGAREAAAAAEGRADELQIMLENEQNNSAQLAARLRSAEAAAAAAAAEAAAGGRAAAAAGGRAGVMAAEIEQLRAAAISESELRSTADSRAVAAAEAALAATYEERLMEAARLVAAAEEQTKWATAAAAAAAEATAAREADLTRLEGVLRELRSRLVQLTHNEENIPLEDVLELLNACMIRQRTEEALSLDIFASLGLQTILSAISSEGSLELSLSESSH